MQLYMFSTNPSQVLLIIAAVFTIGGGLSAVIWTDAVQVLHSAVLPCLLFCHADGADGGRGGRPLGLLPPGGRRLLGPCGRLQPSSGTLYCTGSEILMKVENTVVIGPSVHHLGGQRNPVKVLFNNLINHAPPVG